MRAVPTCWARTGPALSGVGGDGAGRGAGRGAGGGWGETKPFPRPPSPRYHPHPDRASPPVGFAESPKWGPFFFFLPAQNNRGNNLILRGSVSFWQGAFPLL